MFRLFAGDSEIAFRAGTLVFVRSCIATGSAIQTRLMSSTIVKVFVTKLTAPVGFTETLPWFNASAMDTSRMRNTLITILPLPTIEAPALSRMLTDAMFVAAALTAHSCIAIRS